MDMQEKAREKMNWFERVLHKIPGFKGYCEREFRRDADRLQREFIVQQLQEVMKSLNFIIQAVSRQKNLELLTEYDLFTKSLQKTINEIRYADQGYSGFFDLIKIKEVELDSVYKLDSEMVDLACRFNNEFKKIITQSLELPGLEPSGDYLLQINARFAKRSAFLKGYQG
ncbi:MAG: hypothetical protein WCL37_00420 [Chrysiogenales bacterium]